MAVSVSLLVAAAVLFVVLGLQPRLVSESSASSRLSYWHGIWRSSDATIRLGKDLLPADLPGPSDSWAGSKAHSLSIGFDADPGPHTLVLLSYEAHESMPPRLSTTLNGQHVADIQVRPGTGRHPPYVVIQDHLTVEIPLATTSRSNIVVLTTTAGSWVAPARLRLVRGIEFRAGKSAYLLAAHNGYLFGLLALLGGGVFSGLISRGLREALIASLLVLLSSSSAAALGEFLSRQYLAGHRQSLTVDRGSGSVEQGQELRYTTMVEPDDDFDIVYHMRPSLDGFFLGHPLKTNSQGMRSAEIRPEKAPGVMRILGLGDSVMMGWRVSHEDTALTRVGHMVAERLGTPSEILNLGCPSYNTAVEVATYRKRARRYRPDVVILIFMENDFGFPGLMLDPVDRYALRKSYLKEQIRKGLVPYWRDALLHEETEFISTRELTPLRGRNESEMTERDRWLKRVEAYYTRMVGLDAVAAQLKDLGDMLREDGALGLVVYNPIRLTVGDPASYERYAGFVVATAQGAGMEAMDMTPVYEAYLRQQGRRKMEEALWVSPTDWHPNAVAHGLIARAVIDLLGKRKPQFGRSGDRPA